MLVLLAATHFVFMATKTTLLDTPSCISTIVEMHPDVLVDLLAVLVVIFGVIAPSSTLGGMPIIAVLVGEATLAVVGPCGN